MSPAVPTSTLDLNSEAPTQLGLLVPRSRRSVERAPRVHVPPAATVTMLPRPGDAPASPMPLAPPVSTERRREAAAALASPLPRFRPRPLGGTVFQERSGCARAHQQAARTRGLLRPGLDTRPTQARVTGLRRPVRDQPSRRRVAASAAAASGRPAGRQRFVSTCILPVPAVPKLRSGLERWSWPIVYATAAAVALGAAALVKALGQAAQ